MSRLIGRSLMLAIIVASVGAASMQSRAWAADARQGNAAENARIEQAIQAYVAKMAADEATDRDRRAANEATALSENPSSPILGDPKGDVVIVEFFDYACPYCKAVEPRIEALLRSDKHVKLVLKEFPILTPASMVAARMALASFKQGKYRQFHLALMRFSGYLQASDVIDTAKSVGLNVERLKNDMYAPDVTDEIIANFNLARSIRAFQTPTFIVGGHILTGASAEIDFPKVIASARARPIPR